MPENTYTEIDEIEDWIIAEQLFMKNNATEFELDFSKNAVAEIAEIATVVNDKMENIGARRLHTLMTTLLEDILFDTPSKKTKDVKVDKSFVRKKLDNIIDDEDLRRYIL